VRLSLRGILGGTRGGGHEHSWFTFTVAFWLWLTVVFANLAEALAEGRGKAQADALRAMRTETTAHLKDGGEVPASELQRGHVVIEYATAGRIAKWERRMTSSPERLEGTVDPKLLEILVCPLTKGPLEFDATRQELISRSAKLAYPIRDGIPIMLPEEARKID